MQEVHPFQFLAGEYSDQRYDEQVSTCAQAFVGDDELKALVRDAATQLFTQLATSNDATKLAFATVKHKNIAFCVRCSAQQPVGDGRGSTTSGSTSYSGSSSM